MSSFVQRLKDALGDRGYQSYARRSVQTAILYEANRCLCDQLPSMRPFQRKLAFYDQAKALLESTGFSSQQQTEIMWRTGTSREVLNPDSAWKRAKLVEKELEKIRDKVKPLCVDGKTHNEIIDEYIQQQYEYVTNQTGKSVPRGWEHSHSNVIMTYRMYFQGTEPNPDLPPPAPFKEVVVPIAKPKHDVNYMVRMPGSDTDHVMTMGSPPSPTPNLDPHMESAEDRMAILKEVRAHMDLLNDFVGIIPQEQITKRKRELYNALPSAPPSVAERTKRCRQELADMPVLNDV